MTDPRVVLMHGGPARGFTVYGPFNHADDAIAFAEDKNLQDAWFVVPLVSPVEA